MRVLVNGLSIGAPSGRHVLYGHVRQLAQWTAAEHEWLIVHQAGEELPADLRLPNVRTHAAPERCRNWLSRTAWESWELPRLMRRAGVDLYFAPNGMILPRSPAPQATLAQNPWCLTPSIHRTSVERFKGRLQRAAYRRAYSGADLMVYNSRHMQDLYARNARGTTPAPACIAYQGIDDATHEAASRVSENRDPWTILSVSVMAHWKGAETLIDALQCLRSRNLPARLRLVGPWPDAAYEARIRRQIDDRNLQAAVEITGMLPLEELRAAYASAQVFCLMSRCESFGIPAVEAQAFGTPVVGSNVCAMPEVCGAGGVFGPPDDAAATARLLEPLLTDNDHWSQLSLAARANAAKYRWSECSQPLLSLFEMNADRPRASRPADHRAASVSRTSAAQR
ncbi:MAG: glycosyltransferase [Planctomycetaceae bacterium]|nr:glycosyltransferase [Planctomycetaceae bacterium]